ncbi:Surface antigen [compost metagenome]
MIFALLLFKNNYLKTSLLFLLFINLSLSCYAQTFRLKISGNTDTENKTIDSLHYATKHNDAKSVENEISLISEKLSKIGFLDNEIKEKRKTSDSTFYAEFRLGKRIKNIHIYIGINTLEKNSLLLPKLKDTTTIPYSEIEVFLHQTINELEQNGYALAKLKLINIQKKNSNLYAELNIELNKQRQLNSIIVKYPENKQKEKFPNGPLTQINRKYKNKTFNKEIIGLIHNDFENFRFVSQIKYPEILLTKDSTKVYVYLEKRKSNTFDGFIGFSNNENEKITLNGYLNIVLENILKSGEELSVYWKSDGNKQKTFNAALDLPYLFKTPANIKAQIQIFKQDSTFQNTKTAIDLGYIINYNTRMYLGYQSTESSDIQNTNDNTISDFTNSFTTTSFRYTKFELNNTLFPKKAAIEFTIGLGKRRTNDSPETAGIAKQLQINLQAMYNFYLNKKNYINLRTQNYYLQSDTYITNELYRFGGINSIRGFTENSLQAQFMSSILTEYRFIISPNLYLHSIVDYCIYKDPLNTTNKNTNENLIGIGLGAGVQTKNGLLKFAIANGTSKNAEKEFYNTMINICYNVKF